MSRNNSNETISNLSDYLKQYISNFYIDKDKRQSLCFREKLEVYFKNGISMNTKPIGEYWMSVESIGPKDREFLIHVFSSMKIDESLRESEVISSVTEELHCLEEKRNEFIQTKDCVHEKNLYISVGERGRYVNIVQKCPCNKQTQSLNISPNDDYKLISEGCNILLTRYLAITDFDGSFSLNVLTINGKIVTCNYECFRARTMEINGSISDVYIIKQKIYENENIIHESENFLTTQGKILCFDWIHTPYIIKISPLLDPNISNQNPIIMPLQAIWREDAEMNSKYFDRKTNEIARQEEYLSLHSEVYNLITDYVQTLLCRKPEDALTFTIEYFKTLIENKISEGSFLDEESKSLEFKSSDICSCDEKESIYYVLLDDLQSEEDIDWKLCVRNTQN